VSSRHPERREGRSTWSTRVILPQRPKPSTFEVVGGNLRVMATNSERRPARAAVPQQAKEKEQASPSRRRRPPATEAQAEVATGRGVAHDAAVIVQPIEGEVAAILNALQLAINRGRRHGVTHGMRFEVLDRHGVKITDPETGAVLGEEVGAKIKVKIVRVHEAYSIAESDERIGGSSLFALSEYITSTGSRRRTLRTEEALFPPLKEEASFVKRGDRVRQIMGQL
jgi:hypothetical protein